MENIQIMRQTVTNSIQAAGKKADLLLAFVRHTKLDLQ